VANDEQTEAKDVTKAEGHSIIAIPAEKSKAVLEFIASLKDQDSDVSGYMLNTGLFGGISYGGMALNLVTESGCVKTQGSDWNCADVDQG
jgi:hypothetical protein